MVDPVIKISFVTIKEKRDNIPCIMEIEKSVLCMRFLETRFPQKIGGVLVYKGGRIFMDVKSDSNTTCQGSQARNQKKINQYHNRIIPL